jgi:hypothetical protein
VTIDIVSIGAGRPSPVIAVHADRHATDKAAATNLNTPVFLAPKPQCTKQLSRTPATVGSLRAIATSATKQTRSAQQMMSKSKQH